MVFRSAQEKKILAIFDSFETRDGKNETGKEIYVISLIPFYHPSAFERNAYDQEKQFLNRMFFLV